MKRIFHLVVMTVIVFSITFSFVWTLNQAPAFAGDSPSKVVYQHDGSEPQQEPQKEPRTAPRPAPPVPRENSQI